MLIKLYTLDLINIRDIKKKCNNSNPIDKRNLREMKDSAIVHQT